jgi:hypothetical protein
MFSHKRLPKNGKRYEIATKNFFLPYSYSNTWMATFHSIKTFKNIPPPQIEEIMGPARG